MADESRTVAARGGLLGSFSPFCLVRVRNFTEIDMN